MAHDFSTSTTGIAPSTPKPPAASANRLPHRATPKFYLRSHPLRWQLIDGEFLPLLGTLKEDLGTGGCDKDGNIDEAQIMSAARGWSLIPWDAVDGGYIRAWPAQGGEYHCLRWETPRWIGDRVLESKVDTDGYNAFLREMIAEGYIPAPDPDVLEQVHLDQQRKEVDRLAKESHKPGVMPAYKASKAKLEAMEKAIEALRSPPPKRSSRKGKD